MKRLVATLLMAAGICGAACAGETEVRQALEKKYPGVKVEQIGKSPVAGIWEVYTNNGELLYVDDKGAYVFAGPLIDVERGANLTDERVAKLSFVRFKDLPFESSFKIVRGKGTRQMAYFADPNCGYCKKIEQDMMKLDNVTIHVFPVPILGADSMEKTRVIWCSKDRPRVWQDWMLKGVAITGASTCDTSAIDKLLAFSRRKAISGTPTLFFTSDQRVPGALPLEQIEKQLAAASAR
jgi:thiol:disulfide interchange protein DsbC